MKTKNTPINCSSSGNWFSVSGNCQTQIDELTNKLIVSVNAEVTYIGSYTLNKGAEYTVSLNKSAGGLVTDINGEVFIVDYFTTTELTNDGTFSISGTSTYNFDKDGTLGGNLYLNLGGEYSVDLGELKASNGHIKVSSNWKNAFSWFKLNGVWKRCLIWQKINGVWKKGI